MTPGNYLEHAITWLRDNSAAVPKRDAAIIASFNSVIPTALKAPRFLLPRFGISITHNLQHLVVPARLPYPCIVLEYLSEMTTNEEIKTTVIAREHRGDDGQLAIIVDGLYERQHLHTWRTGHVTAVVFTSQPALKGVPLIYGVDQLTLQCIPPNEMIYQSVDGRAAHSVLSLIQALQCCNVETETIPAPTALNKKRIANGKLPFVEYKILALGDERGTSRCQGGSHASPRQHLRRGHIRRLPDARTVWVNQCMVGDPRTGMIVKDYRVLA